MQPRSGCWVACTAGLQPGPGRRPCAVSGRSTRQAGRSPLRERPATRTQGPLSSRTPGSPQQQNTREELPLTAYCDLLAYAQLAGLTTRVPTPATVATLVSMIRLPCRTKGMTLRTRRERPERGQVRRAGCAACTAGSGLLVLRAERGLSQKPHAWCPNSSSASAPGTCTASSMRC